MNILEIEDRTHMYFHTHVYSLNKSAQYITKIGLNQVSKQ